MNKNNEIPNEGGHVNWEKLERPKRKATNDGRVRKAKVKVQHENQEEVDAEVKRLSEEEKSLPYPDAFLAEINLMRKKITGSKANIASLSDDDTLDDDTLDDDELDDEVFGDDDDELDLDLEEDGFGDDDEDDDDDEEEDGDYDDEDDDGDDDGDGDSEDDDEDDLKD
jgi:hypothetical protein